MWDAEINNTLDHSIKPIPFINDLVPRKKSRPVEMIKKRIGNLKKSFQVRKRVEANKDLTARKNPPFEIV